jgi:hypothetical protein
MYLIETGYEEIGWISLAQDRFQWWAFLDIAVNV